METIISGGIGWAAAIGGLLLAIVLAWAVISNRKRGAAQFRREEEATRRLREELNREDEARDSNG